MGMCREADRSSEGAAGSGTLVATTAKRSGFTIIELMITIGIIGILATIAIPTLMQFQLKAKAAEVKGNLSAIRVAEEAYFGEYGGYVSALPAIPTIVRTTQMPWALLPADAHGFNTLGWAPTGPVYFQYAAKRRSRECFAAWRCASTPCGRVACRSRWSRRPIVGCPRCSTRWSVPGSGRRSRS